LWYATRTDGPHPGRFDLADPDGTCYWAMTPATALLEVPADPQQLDPPVLSVAALQPLSAWRADTVPASRSKLADTTVASVPGLTAELATIVPYDLAWQWADALHAEGRSGIVYRSRFGQDDAVALFGPAGIPPHTPEATRQPALAHGGELPPPSWPRSARSARSTSSNEERIPDHQVRPDDSDCHTGAHPGGR
jgi:hypothetical protein